MLPYLVIVPTYNEKANIEPLVAEIFAASPAAHILFVDDNSQDGTPELIEALQARYPEAIFKLSRAQKLGLGTAYVAGFRWGLERDYEVLIEMDADLSHQPRYLPEFLQQLKTADVVVGSRYLEGGGTENWSPWRKLISKAGSCYARFCLGRKVYDFTGGYNAWKRSVLEAIDLNQLRSDGYVFQIELKYRALLAGFKIQEVPIIFVERRAGESKMSVNIVLEAIYKVIFLRLTTCLNRRR